MTNGTLKKMLAPKVREKPKFRAINRLTTTINLVILSYSLEDAGLGAESVL
jgi:hypothetical protein